MLDFTSALYLGLRHPSQSLRPWPALTTGKPAPLLPLANAIAVASELAALQGCERATLAGSTLHLFWDLFGILAREQVRIYMDSGSYAIAKWGVQRAAALGIPVRSFPHHDAAAVRDMLERDRGGGGFPIIVADGFCPGCGASAPITEYLKCVDHQQGYLVIDDTQALGVLGENPSATAPYGHHGGGSLRYWGLHFPHVIIVSSLAKGFGAPLAALSSSAAVVRHFEDLSETRVHCSPPSAATIRAADRALSVNRSHGEHWRDYLLGLVRRFHARLGQIGVAPAGGLFPVLAIKPPRGIDARALHALLLQFGVRTALTRGCGGAGASITFIITALHDPSDIDRAVETISHVMAIDGNVSASLGRTV
jgi:8-amino-7-oxononanoate synthase